MANTYTVDSILPAPGYVIVEPKELPNEVAGIINPNKDKEVPQWGTVIKVGADVPDRIEGEKGDTMLVKRSLAGVGQTVIYKKWGGNDVEIGGKKYYFLRFEEIIGVVV